MRFVIVTGMSGAGKSSTLKMLEDAGYFCVDNLPVPLISKFAQLLFQEHAEYDKIAIGVDIRSGQGLSDLGPFLEQMKQKRQPYEILYLDASDEVLIKRYKETRRTHPLAGSGRVESGIKTEREKTAFLKKEADYILDTSQLLVRELKQQIDKIFVQNEAFHSFMITVLSFGFKYGIPADADLVFDVRFLANPYYVPELKYKTGNDREVQEYVMQTEAAGQFLNKLEDMLKFLIPNYINEGKNQLVIGIGCTGGKHRSVTLANAITRRLSVLEYGIKVEHRDIGKDTANVVLRPSEKGTL
ncbi:MAG: RNase adapter RapZ [Lachnospiraceae bacterium]|nr:RNase adapter RapZ [Lachnospiraceae bacterium]